MYKYICIIQYVYIPPYYTSRILRLSSAINYYIGLKSAKKLGKKPFRFISLRDFNNTSQRCEMLHEIQVYVIWNSFSINDCMKLLRRASQDCIINFIHKGSIMFIEK